MHDASYAALAGRVRTAGTVLAICVAHATQAQPQLGLRVVAPGKRSGSPAAALVRGACVAAWPLCYKGKCGVRVPHSVGVCGCVCVCGSSTEGGSRAVFV